MVVTTTTSPKERSYRGVLHRNRSFFGILTRPAVGIKQPDKGQRLLDRGVRVVLPGPTELELGDDDVQEAGVNGRAQGQLNREARDRLVDEINPNDSILQK